MAQTQLPGNQIKDADLKNVDIATDAAIARSKLQLISAIAEKTTPVDADVFEGADSAASNVSKKFSWANIKATILAAIASASTTVAGIVEIAIGSEVDTGTDATRAISPDSLAGSNFGKRVVQLKVFDDATVITTGNGKIKFMIPVELNGMNLVDVEAFVTTVSSSGTPTVAIYNYTDSQDMLSTNITIDANETSSLTAATAPVINATYDDVATGDIIGVDIDGAGTGAKGIGVLLSFQLP